MQLTLKSNLFMRYVKLTRYLKLAAHRHDRGQSCTMHLGSIYMYCASWGKDCAGTILPSVEHNWLLKLKWSWDK